MKFSVLLRRGLWLGAAAGILGGCSSVEPRYYNLASLPGPVLTQSFTGARGGVKIYNASIPSRLDRDTIVQGLQDYQLQMIKASSWGEPLGEMISQTLADDLSQRLPGRVIVTQNQPAAIDVSEFIDVAIQSFERDSSNHVIVRGVISVKKKDNEAHQNEIKSSEMFKWQSPQTVPADTESFVASLSQGVAAIADKLASTIR